VYELNLEDFSNLDEGDVQEEELNVINPNESENKVKKNTALVVKEEVLGNFLVEFLEEVNMILKESHDISPLKLPDSLPTMLDFHHVKGLEQHAPHPLMLDIQHVIGLEQHVELHNLLPLTCDEKDENNHNLLGYVQTTSNKASNNACSTPHPRSYGVHSYVPRKLVDLLVSLL
jgi:hypothetical protein